MLSYMTCMHTAGDIPHALSGNRMHSSDLVDGSIAEGQQIETGSYQMCEKNWPKNTSQIQRLI